MKKNMQKTIVLALIASGILVGSQAVAAVSNVANTKHNFAIGGGPSGGSSQYQSTTITQVCIFCHTPHNAGQTRVLWNKANNSVTNFRLYTSSGSLRTVTRQQSSLSANSPSLLCLSCHDGKTAMNVLHSSSSGADASGAGYPAGSKFIQTASGFAPVVMSGPLWNMGAGAFDPSMNLGRASDGSNDLQGDNLTDDHPIGFNYQAVLDERSAGLFTIAQVNAKSSNSVRFFGSNNKVECSTCHDPHVDYGATGNPLLKPFLVMDNSGSKLCLSCHDK